MLHALVDAPAMLAGMVAVVTFAGFLGVAVRALVRR